MKIWTNNSCQFGGVACEERDVLAVHRLVFEVSDQWTPNGVWMIGEIRAEGSLYEADFAIVIRRLVGAEGAVLRGLGAFHSC